MTDNLLMIRGTKKTIIKKCRISN